MRGRDSASDESRSTHDEGPVRHTRSDVRSHDGRAVADLHNLPPTLSVEEAGRLCGISRNAAYRAAHRGELPSLRLGRCIRVPTARLLELLGVHDDQLTGERP